MATMNRHDYSRVDPKRRANIDHKKRQFAKAEFQHQNYEHRLNFYILPPTAEITLEEFETWAINRLKGMSSRNPAYRICQSFDYGGIGANG